MPSFAAIVERPRRWDVPFDAGMTDEVVARVLTVPPFSAMNPARFPRTVALADIIRNDAALRRYRAGEIVVREGDYGTSAFLILSGQVRVVLAPGLPEAMLGRRSRRRRTFWQILSQAWANSKYPEIRRGGAASPDPRLGQRALSDQTVRVFLQDIPRVLNEHRTVTLGAGEIFGEMAALSRMPRTATVFAETEAELLEIRWQGFRDLMRYDEALRRHVEQLYRERALETYLRSLPLFAKLDDRALQAVMAATEFATFGEYDWSGEYKKLAAQGRAVNEPIIAAEGDYPNGIVLIRAGFARVTQRFGDGERTLNYLGAGGMFGLAEVAHNWRHPDQTRPLQFSLRALGYTHVLLVPTRVLEQVVLPAVPASSLPALVEEPQPVGGDGAWLDFLADNRFLNGTAAMVIDLDRCTRCDDCVRACAATHDNNPRFLRHGPIHGRWMIANACMHCADPVCMIGCPTGAIHRNAFGGQVVINQATCIGCQICALNCPYDAIRMVEIRDEQGRIMVDAEFKPILKATKCDLCATQYVSPACERACPHDALVRINLNRPEPLLEWTHRHHRFAP
ncbi:MAG: cyclic nucleotide-binding domain-containing protein [Verrucomicrobiae bacterium]|nr:cyclic nucleotide-binding domain-containing protein [Verrucomicrobiae bacterium]